MNCFTHSLWIGLAIWAGAVSAQEPSPDKSTRSAKHDRNVIAEFRVARSGDFLLIPVVIGDNKYHFILDTGAATTVLCTSLTEMLPPLKRSTQPSTQGLSQRYEMPDAILAGTALRVTGDATKFDLSELRRMSGYDIKGFLGMTFLDSHIIELDFDTGLVSFLAARPKVDSHAFPIERDELNRPTIRTEVAANKSVAFLIDTGMATAGVGEMASSLFDELLGAEQLVLVGPKAKTLTVSGVVTNRKAQLNTFKMGDSQHQNLRVNEGNLNGLGLDYLSRYKVTLDLVNDQAFLEPAKRFSEATVFDASGMIVSRIEGKTVVERVHPDGPAFAADIRAGDVFTQINGRQVNDHSLFALRRALSRPDQTVALSLERSGESRVSEFTLKNWQKAVLTTDRP